MDRNIFLVINWNFAHSENDFAWVSLQDFFSKPETEREQI